MVDYYIDLNATLSILKVSPLKICKQTGDRQLYDDMATEPLANFAMGTNLRLTLRLQLRENTNVAGAVLALMGPICSTIGAEN